MHSAATGRVSAKTRSSLATRFTILFVSLFVLMIGAFGVASYREVRNAATIRATERLARVASELAATAARSSAARLASLRTIAQDSLVRRIVSTPTLVAPRLDGGNGDDRRADVASDRDGSARLDALFASRRLPTDSTVMGVQLWTTTGERRYGVEVHSVDSTRLAEALRQARASDSALRSPLYSVRGQVRLWTVVPVRRGTAAVGFLAEQRFVGASVETERLIARLTGEDSRVFFASRGSFEWASVSGRPASSPIGALGVDALPEAKTLRVADVPEDPVYAAAASVAATPWLIVLVQSERSILAPPRAFLRGLLTIGLLLVVLGAVAALWLSRLETQSLRDLREAAEAMATGAYGQTVLPSGGAETAALADAFNTMSLHITGAHTALAERNAALTEANESKARFLAVMSHELRTPLHAIGGHAELLALGVHGPVTHAQQDAMQRIVRSKEQLLRLVSDILHYARIEASPLPLTSVEVTLSDVFDNVRGSVADEFVRRGVVLDFVPTTATVFGDEIRVQQILTNLVVNAMQFTPSGGSVTISGNAEGNLTVVTVRDTGVGIPLASQDSIFEPFVQADNSLTRRARGAGLGLAIVRQLVMAMSGTVTVSSLPGEGATFTVTLPSRPPFADESTAVVEDAEAFAWVTP